MLEEEDLAAEEQGDKIKVLVVDDSLLIRVAARRMLEDRCEVVLAEDGADAWQKLTTQPDIQVVFTDLVMPEMDGFELLRRIRAAEGELANLPVIVTTGADNPDIAKQKAIALGATDFVSKPFDAADLTTRALSYAKLNRTARTLREQALLDPLTGHLNAKGFRRQLEKELAFVVRHRSPLSVLAIELDGFKDLFIRVGRRGAEVIVRKLGEVLATIVRREDSLARTGLATFMVSMPLAREENALEVADQICRTVAGLRARLGGKPLRLSVSVGVCGVEPTRITSADTVVEVAAEALGRARKAGRNQIARLGRHEFEVIQARKAAESLSLDQLLQQVENGNLDAVVPFLDLAVARLAPLVALLSVQQRQRLLEARARLP